MSRSLREVIAEFDPDAFGTARWEDIPTPATPSWITDEWTTDNAPWYDPTGGGPARKHNPADSQELDPDETFKNKTYTENRVGARREEWGSYQHGDTGQMIHMIRGNGNKTHFEDDKGNQVGPEQSNVAPAAAWALSNGYFNPDIPPFVYATPPVRIRPPKEGRWAEQVRGRTARLSPRRADAMNPFSQTGPGMGAGSGGDTAPGATSYTPMGQTPQAPPAAANTDPAAAGTAADTSGAMPGGDMPNQQQNIQPGTSMVPDASMATAKKIEDLFSRPSLSAVDKIAASVLASNPGLGLERAVQVARDTITRYPAVTRTAEIGPLPPLTPRQEAENWHRDIFNHYNGTIPKDEYNHLAKAWKPVHGADLPASFKSLKSAGWIRDDGANYTWQMPS